MTKKREKKENNFTYEYNDLVDYAFFDANCIMKTKTDGCKLQCSRNKNYHSKYQFGKQIK